MGDECRFGDSHICEGEYENSKTVSDSDESFKSLKILKKYVAESEKSNPIRKVENILFERQSTHGDPKVNFKTIARLWSEYLELEGELTGKDVSMMMILLKIARIKNGDPHEDDILDIIGYGVLGYDL